LVTVNNRNEGVMIEIRIRKYIATKIVSAFPARSGAVAEEKGIPFTGDPNEPGYRVTYPDGYVSWCPKDIFEAANRPCDAMNFGLALEALKMGKRVARANWNGKGQWVGMVKAENYIIEAPPFGNGQDLAGEPPNVSLLPWIGLKNAQEKFVPWVPSQGDMLADDWTVVE
jgi:hypothetical protein